MNTESRFPLVFSHPHFGREGYILFAPSIGEARREAVRIHSRYSQGWKLDLYENGEIAFSRKN